MRQNRSSRDLDAHLNTLIAEAKACPVESWKRRRLLNQVIRLIMESRRLWHEPVPHYEDALQQTWLYFCQNLEKYEPTRGSVITWLDHYLKWRIRDFKKAPAYDLLPEKLANLASSPDIPNIERETRQWIEHDSTGELKALHIRNHPELNAQVLLLRRLPPEEAWKDIATEFRISVSTIANFYQRQCVPRLRNFGQQQGYLD